MWCCWRATEKIEYSLFAKSSSNLFSSSKSNSSRKVISGEIKTRVTDEVQRSGRCDVCCTRGLRPLCWWTHFIFPSTIMRVLHTLSNSTSHSCTSNWRRDCTVSDDTKTADVITTSEFSIYGSLKSPLEHPLSECRTSASARSHLSTLQPSTFERIMPLKSAKHQWCQKLLGRVFDKLTIQSDSRM